MRGVGFDQAIFTSASSSRGEGYRIVAASAGLSSEERRSIQQCAPSHGGLCSGDADFVSVGFVPLASGRLCVFRSTHAGMEQTGRGGRRVYSHFLILAAEDFSAFDNNPFDILRAADAAGVFVPDPSASGSLEPLRLSPVQDACAASSITECIDTVGALNLHRSLQRLMGGRKVVLLTNHDCCQLAESLFLAVPAPLRVNVSLATGLRFSLSRGLTLCLVGPDNAPASRFLRGSRIELINLAEEQGPAEDDADAPTWPDMAVRLWEDGAVEDLITTSSRDQIDIADEGLARLAGLMLDAHSIPRTDLRSVIARATHRTASVPQTMVEGEVLERFWNRVGSRLVELWPVPQDDAARTHWHVLAELPRRNPLIPDLLGDSLRTLLVRIAAQDPLDGLARALLLAREPGDSWSGMVDACENTLLNQLLTWAAGSDDPLHCEKALALASDWHRTRPKCEIAGEAVEALGTHREALAAHA